jgi:hypothetical protein
MEYSVMTKKETISEDAKKTLSFILPYFSWADIIIYMHDLRRNKFRSAQNHHVARL